VQVVNWVIFLIDKCLLLLLSGVPTLIIVTSCNTSTACTAVRTVIHATQALHLLWLIESGTNSVSWVECLHLILSRIGETRNTSTASIAMTHWKWNKQCLFALLLFEWSICILPLVGETHNTSTAVSTVTHWKWSKECLLLLLSGVP